MSVSNSCLRALLSDCTVCLLQQMYFWGRDVIWREGNLLCEYGFERNRSPGLQGTSCYRKPWEEGFIELHGACAGWYSLDSTDSFVYIRPLRRVYRYSAADPLIPGQWNHTHLHRSDPKSIFEVSKPFIGWWIEYEQWIAQRTRASHRDECYRAYRNLPATLRHLPPEEVCTWLRQFHRDPSDTPRLFGRNAMTKPTR